MKQDDDKLSHNSYVRIFLATAAKDFGVSSSKRYVAKTKNIRMNLDKKFEQKKPQTSSTKWGMSLAHATN